MMRFPQLVPDKVCTTPISIELEQGLGEDGAPKKITVFSGFCNWQESGRIVFDKERKAINLSGVALLNGEPVPDSEHIEGTVYVGTGKTPKIIHSYDRARNPDGSVNYTKLELI